MFGLFASQEKKARENAANWLELADKVWQFRRDVLSAEEGGQLLKGSSELKQMLKERAGAEKLKLGIEALEEILRRTGGAIYPKTSLVENVEFFLVAAIVILGIRTYFVQPFKIPTNSMWPTYNGMTPEVYRTKADEPSAVAVAARTVLFGAWPHRIDAPADGEVLIPIGGESRGLVHCHVVPGRSWLVLPTELREYTLVVGSTQVKTKVPIDFDFDWAIFAAFFARDAKDAYNQPALYGRITEKMQAGAFVETYVDGQLLRCIRTGKIVRAGERILSFDELTGDQLFVDRVSYHFVRPEVGQGFVFRTENIHSRYMEDARTGRQVESYYIKRLVGTPGDLIEVRQPAIYRNGRPITGAGAFEANAKRTPPYAGYFAIGNLAPGQSLTVPEKSFFPMGDNSGNSQDGRYWGFVPAKDAVGRPLFIYYPFTKHWGPAR